MGCVVAAKFSRKHATILSLGIQQWLRRRWPLLGS